MERERATLIQVFMLSQSVTTHKHRRDQISLKCSMENILFRSEIYMSSPSISAFALSPTSKPPVISAGCASKIHPSSSYFFSVSSAATLVQVSIIFLWKLSCIAFLLGIKRQSYMKGMEWKSAIWPRTLAMENFSLYPNYKRLSLIFQKFLFLLSHHCTPETYHGNAHLCLDLCCPIL